jgi:molecular chaperone HtpG
MTQQTLSFQAEVKQLLQLMIHSLYSNKEIFLRELVSNASDAADKLRFEALSQPNLYEDQPELEIRIAINKEARTLTISDNGIGMTREEVISHLGTIAKSGTKEFFQKLSGDQQKDAALIGQFGVGFYSAFIVADKVTVNSRRAGQPSNTAVRWESDGTGEFSVTDIEQVERGTHITLHLRPEEEELLSSWKLKSILQKYSDHISLPILMQKETWDEEQKAMVLQEDFETINQASALWTKNKSEITDEQYHSFYQYLSHDHTPPLAWTHNRVEGRSEYTQLLYLPAKAQADIYDRNQHKGIKLYVKRVFIMDDAEQLLPTYLRFIKGLVDSADLPLNVSREILQESRDIRTLREACSKRVLSMLEDLAENQQEKFETFWQEFGQVFKEGVGEDFANRERIIKLLRFASTHTHSDQQTVSLADYLSRMQDGQNKIYYLTADSYRAALNSPHLEIFNKKNIEVLLLSDRVDEWMLSFLHEFEGKEWVSVARGGLDLGELSNEEEKNAQEKTAQSMEPFVQNMKKILEDRAKDVRITFRLTDSPSCLISDEGDMSNYLQRLLKQAGQNTPPSKPILEINPSHPLIKKIQTLAEQDVAEWAHILFDQALVAEGALPEDPASFVRRINLQLVAA